MSEHKSMKEIAEEMGVFEQKDNREKIRDIIHPNKPCFKDYPCPVPDWGACRECNEQIDKILALFSDESEIIGKIKLTVETELALERDIIKQINEAKIEEAKREERERIRMAFWEVFKGAGEVWFPYPPSGSEEECEGGVQTYWDELLEALKAGK